MKKESYSGCSSEQVVYEVDDCIQGQSLPLSEVIKQYLITGVAPAPLPSQYEFTRDLTDEEFDSFDGHRLDHDLSEVSACSDALSILQQQLQANKKPSSKPVEPAPAEPAPAEPSSAE